jgi:hypothetical protein
MYKITVLFNSNIDGVYTKEEETATDFSEMQHKQSRMMDRWFEILCPHIKIEQYYSRIFLSVCDYKTQLKKKQEIMLKFINQTLENLDNDVIEREEGKRIKKRKRTFELTIEEFQE